MNRFAVEREWAAELPAELALARGAVLSSGRTGVILGIVPTARFGDLPRFYEFGAPYTSTRLISDATTSGETGGGAGLRPEAAKIKAVGEAIERYAVAIYRKAVMPFGSYRELSRANRCLDPGRLAGRVDTPGNDPRAAPLRWALGVDLFDRAPTLVPAQLVYLPYHPSPPEGALWSATSSGVAAGTTLAGAVLRAFLELIEREAFLLVFFHRHTAKAFDLNTVADPLFQSLLRNLPFSRLELQVLDLTTDLQVPVALAVMVDRSGRYPALTLGAKAGLSQRAAVIGAVEEALYTLPWSRTVVHTRRDEVARIRTSPGRLASLEDRMLYWSPPEALAAVGFLVEPRDQHAVDSKPTFGNTARDASRKLLELARDRGVELFGVDLTTCDLEAAGFRVVRVVAPTMVPLYLDEAERSFTGDRLFDVPRELGWTEARSRAEDLLQIPHPFL